MSNIRTYNELLEEKQRLDAAVVVQKAALRQDLIELREDVRPALDLLSTVGKMANRTGTNPIIGMAISLAGTLLLKRAIFSGGSKIARVIVPFLAKKVSSLFS